MSSRIRGRSGIGSGIWTGLILGVVGIATAAGADRDGIPARPNVVVILVDDLRYDALGCTGHPFVRTPHIDRIAREGANVRNAFVTTPLCSPARASFLTGRYVHAHGVTDNGDHAAESHRLVTFPRLLHDAGYETAFVGKWHMGNDSSPRPGFDRWVSFKGQGVYLDPLLNVDGQERKVEGYITDLLTDEAVAFLRRPRERPFLLYLSHKAVHGPFTPAPRHEGLYAEEPIPVPASAADTLEGKPALRRDVEPPQAKAKARVKAKAKANDRRPGPGEGAIRNQLRGLQAIDDGVGRIFEALEAIGHRDDTLVVFTSDNGYFWGEHGLGDKRAAYGESIRIPLLMRLPGLIRPGTTPEVPVLNIDLAPTVLDLAGVSVPPSLHGRSLVPILRGDTSGWRTAFLAEYFAEPRYPRIPTWRAVRTDRWKYIHYPELAGMDELYDLRADPHELRNLIDDPSVRDVLPGLRADLRNLVEATP